MSTIRKATMMVLAMAMLLLLSTNGNAAAVAEDVAPSRAVPKEVTNDGAATTEVLLKTTASWDDKPYAIYPAGEPELTLVRIVIPSHTALPWHTHPMPNAAYVVKGELTVMQYDTGVRRTLVARDTLPEMVGAVHRGYSGPDPVELLVFYAGASGLPLSERANVE